MSQELWTLDFETRSAAPFGKGANSVTQYEYSVHPSTLVLCLAWSRDGDEVDLWHPAFEDMTPALSDTKKGQAAEPLNIEATPEPLDLFDAVRRGDCLFEAHNAGFERAIWDNVCVARMGWPKIDSRRWRCSAVKAAAFALPRGLGDACTVMRVPHQKDKRGMHLINILCKPAAKNSKVRKRDLGVFLQTHKDLMDLFSYCIQDVRAEHSFSSSLRDIRPEELETWFLDQDMNWDGISIDMDMLSGAEKILEKAKQIASEEIEAVTGGAVGGITKRVQMLDWLDDQWFVWPTQDRNPDFIKQKKKKKDLKRTDPWRTLKSEMLGEYLELQLEDHVRRGLEIWERNAKSSTGKYKKIRSTVNKDDHKVRNNLVFHGASTGRWTGKGMQVHNFPSRGSYGAIEMDEKCDLITQGDYETLALYYDSEEIMTILSRALRGVIIPDPGYVFRGADYSAIEARGVFWAAGHEVGMDVFRDFDKGIGPDAYCWQAEKMYKRPITKKDPERAHGKVVVLGAGYQMGWAKLIIYAHDNYKIDLTPVEAKVMIDEYRETNWPVRDMWKAMENAAILATRRKGKGDAASCGPFRFKVMGPFLSMRLPSGRLLSYLRPQVKPREIKVRNDPENPERVTSTFIKDSLSFEGMDTYSHTWGRVHTYGGKLVENAVQALCRDIMRDAMLRLIGTRYQLKFTVHDEIIAQTKIGEGSDEEFAEIMAQPPEWALDMPIAAEGWTAGRFHKG